MTNTCVAFTVDDNFYPGLLVAATSALFFFQAETPLELFVIDMGLSDKHWDDLNAKLRKVSGRFSLHRIKLSLEDKQDWPKLGNSVATYARIFLPSLLDRPRVIYLDVDILVLRNLRELWNTPFDGKSTMAVRDYACKTLSSDCPWLAPGDAAQDLPYFNGGIMFVDLNKWRTLDVTGQSLRLIQKDPSLCRCCDQTVLNYVLRGDVKLLDRLYNIVAGLRDSSERFHDDAIGPAIFHYLLYKPWISYRDLKSIILWYYFYALITGKPCENIRIATKKRHYVNIARVIAYSFLIRHPLLYKAYCSLVSDRWISVGCGDVVRKRFMR